VGRSSLAPANITQKLWFICGFAIDDEGKILDVLVQTKRTMAAVLKLMR